MSLMSASIAVGGALLARPLAMGVSAWGWRWTALVSGLCMMLLGIPLAVFVRRSPESLGLLPDGDSPGQSSGTATSEAGKKRGNVAEVDFPATRAMRTVAYWMLILATMFRVAGLNTIMVHFVPIMVWKGLTEERAAFLLAAYALFSVVTHLFLGWIADFVHKPRLMAVSMAGATAALLVLIYGQGEWPLWVFVFLFTTSESIFPVTWATVGDFFGRKHFATIRGSMSFFYQWGNVVAPVVAGAIYDRSQTYDPMLWGLTVLFTATVFLYAFLVRPLVPR
jgi:MFS family permease